MGKEKISVTLDEEQAEQLAEMVGKQYANRSEAVRELLEKGRQYDELEAERDVLRRRLDRTDRRIDDLEEIVDYVRDQRERDTARARTRRIRRGASVAQRAKRKLLGLPGVSHIRNSAVTYSSQSK